jgi:fructose-specific phosphotransferase system IIC component
MRRRRYFGANIKPLAPVPKVFDSIKQTIMEPLWLIMIISAILSCICSMFVKGFFSSIRDAIEIITAALILILITSLADYAKDRRFVQL